jgi:hypothetical protein
MKRFAFGLGFACITVLLTAFTSGGGYRVDWPNELSQKENQLIINRYIEHHCTIHLWPHSIADANKNSTPSSEVPIYANLSCTAWDENLDGSMKP